MRTRLMRLIALTVLLHAYIGWRLLPDLDLGPGGLIAGIGFLLLSALLTPLGVLSRWIEPRRVADRLAWAGLLAMGLYSSLLVLTLLRDLILLFAAAGAWLAGAQVPAQMPMLSAMLVPALALLFTIVGFGNARRRASIVNVDVPIAGLPGALHGFRIAQISDIHIGPTIKLPYLSKIVDAVNSLEVDLVAITGDLVDGSVKQLGDQTTPLARLASRHGTFFVTGNHEYYSGAAEWVRELRRLGLRVLENQHVVLEHGGSPLVVAGVTDFNAHHFDAAKRSDPGLALAGAPPDAKFKLLLAHQPRSATAAEKAGFDLQLSGHTHGGQFFPWNFFVRFQQPFTAGLHRLGSLLIYTSRGTGYWGPPKRLGAPSEITHLRLVAA